MNLHRNRPRLNKREDVIATLQARVIKVEARIAKELNPMRKLALQNHLAAMQARIARLQSESTSPPNG